jgi:predicted NAD-dependent protein-ADP-ribosyltransferase YbiA (DUF1768 family)
MNEVSIFNPNDVPFGPLSNNFRKSLFEEYNSVTQYLYANVLNDSGISTLIKNQKNPMVMSTVFMNAYNELIDYTVKTSVFDAIDMKIKSNPEFIKRLIDTRESILVYNSPDPLLGAGPARNGQNLVGRYYMDLRKKLQVQYLEQTTEELKREVSSRVYLYQNVELLLTNLIKSGKSDLSEFIDKSPAQIKDMLVNTDQYNPIDYDAFLKIYENKTINLEITKKLLSDELSLAKILRKRYISKFIDIKLDEKKDFILNVFLQNIISKNYPSITNKDLAIRQQLEKLQDTTDLKNRVYNLYVKKRLFDVEPMYENLNRLLSDKLTIESYAEPPSRDISDEINQLLTPAEYNVILFRDATDPNYGFLSPSDVSTYLYFNNYPYPSIAYYMLYNLIKILPGMTTPEARSHLLVNPLGNILDINNYKSYDVLQNDYNRLSYEKFEERYRRLLSISLRKKFADKELANLLLFTGDKRIEYNDKVDRFLGTGEDGTGMNLTGIIMTEIRGELVQRGIAVEEIQRKVDRLSDRLADNKVLRNWILSRAKDAIRVLTVLQRYFRGYINPKYTVDTSAAEFMITRLYFPCSDIYLKHAGAETDMPVDFYPLMKREMKIDLSRSVIEVIWNYVSALKDNILTHFVMNGIESEEDVRDALKRIQDTIFREAKGMVCKGPYGDPFNDCVAMSVSKILKELKMYMKKNKMAYSLTPEIMEAAISILHPEKGLNLNEINMIETSNDKEISKYFSGGDDKESLEAVAYFNGFLEYIQKIAPDDLVYNRVNRLMFFSSTHGN